MRIVGVGGATVDIISTVPNYPEADQEVRALSRRVVRGGNATNTLVVLAQLGHRCSWAGTLANDQSAALITEDLQHFHIGLSAVQHEPGVTPMSCILCSQDTGSRSIVHYRDLPEYSAKTFQTIDFSDVTWVHFEGRNLVEVEKMLQHLARLPVKPLVSLEIEKPRNGIEGLITWAQVVFFSKGYAQAMGFRAAHPFLTAQAAKYPGNVMTCTWGESGAVAVNSSADLIDCPSQKIEVKDSVGAGDTFIAGFIHAYNEQQDVGEALTFACRLAERKCQQTGLGLV